MMGAGKDDSSVHEDVSVDAKALESAILNILPDSRAPPPVYNQNGKAGGSTSVVELGEADVAQRPGRRGWRRAKIGDASAPRQRLGWKFWQWPDLDQKLATFFPRLGLALGLVIVMIFAYGGWRSWETNNFCLILDDDFAGSALNTNTWGHDVELGGFGTGEFEWATPYAENSFVRDGKLHLVPTVDPDYPYAEGKVLNLTQMEICTATAVGGTSSVAQACEAVQNATTGSTIPPLRSARLTTRKSINIRYGRVEVTAKLPSGDWLWPAIWMMPVNSTYGQWPQSGEIDIMESRGNGPDFISVNGEMQEFPGGHDTVFSTLHWGPARPFIFDSYARTTNGLKYPTGAGSLTQAFHKFGIEWTEKSIRTYIDNKLTRVAYFPFPRVGFWAIGDYVRYSNQFVNPWIGGAMHAPFDQSFYLIINLAVGATNGYFQTKPGILPWNIGDRDAAMKSFMKARDRWQPSWQGEKTHFQIDRVKVWKVCN